MTDEDVMFQIEQAKQLSMIQYQMLTARMDQIDRDSITFRQTILTFICILIIVVTVAGLSVTSPKKGPEPQPQLEQAE